MYLVREFEKPAPWDVNVVVRSVSMVIRAVTLTWQRLYILRLLVKMHTTCHTTHYIRWIIQLIPVK